MKSSLIKGNLYLVPSSLGADPVSDEMSSRSLSLIHRLSHFIAENAKTTRAFLKSINYPNPISSVTILELDKHDRKPDFDHYLKFVREGIDTGLITEAGMPGIADPGADFVLQSHIEGIVVIPLTGPSSLFLALSASGLNGQGFVFHGYLPRESKDRIRKLQLIEKDSQKTGMTQLFIETPYRNHQMIADILQGCLPGTKLCVAAGLTTSKEYIRTSTVSEWKKTTVDIHKIPAVFLLQA
jgi:16S rRNA (cytidine1402-2'-O)-methyltransferase